MVPAIGDDSHGGVVTVVMMKRVAGCGWRRKWWRCGGEMVADEMVMDIRWWCDVDGGVVVAAVGRQPEEVEARGGEWIWGSGRSGHGDNIWFRPERSPENFSGGGGMVAGGKGGRKFGEDGGGR
ncbi:hypothetical protein Tco_1340577 [Tanacetum coccineum]